jgi:hypothetical protein
LSEYFANQDDAIDESPLNSNAKQLTIAFLFQQMGAPENSITKPWSVIGDSNCISAIIKRQLRLSPETDTKTVFTDYLICKAAGIRYNGTSNCSASGR